MQVYLRICSDNFRRKLQTKLSISPSHSILTPGQPVPALTLQHQAPGRVATGVPISMSLVWLNLKKSPRKQDLNLGSSPLKADALTTWPARRSTANKALSTHPAAHLCCVRFLLAVATSVCISQSSLLCRHTGKNLHLHLAMSLLLSLESVCQPVS